jgi:hypothetical protein
MDPTVKCLQHYYVIFLSYHPSFPSAIFHLAQVYHSQKLTKLIVIVNYRTSSIVPRLQILQQHLSHHLRETAKSGDLLEVYRKKIFFL